MIDLGREREVEKARGEETERWECGGKRGKRIERTMRP